MMSMPVSGARSVVSNWDQPVGLADANDTIYHFTAPGMVIDDTDGGVSDLLTMPSQYSFNSLTLVREGSDLVFYQNDVRLVTIKDQFVQPRYFDNSTGMWVVLPDSEGKAIEFVEDAVGVAHALRDFRLTFNSTTGDDFILGTSYGVNPNDAINGGDGNDRIYGLGGNDEIWGGNGNDAIHGDDPDGRNPEFGNDTLYGEGGDDILAGGGGNDTLWGGDGDDLLNGGAGQDIMYGGYGDDVYIVDNLADQVIEPSYVFWHGGDDTVRTNLPIYYLPNLVENLFGTGFSQKLTGNSHGNFISGSSGNDIINGGAGVDKMVGGDGDDIYYVDNVQIYIDTVIEEFNHGNDSIRANISSNYVTKYALVENVENLFWLNSRSMQLVGNALNNNIVGNAGDDIIVGAGGADRMEGKGGNDIYYVNDVNDNVVEAEGQGNDKIQTSVSYNLTGRSIETVNMVGNGHLSVNGNEFSNVINGNSGNNNIRGLGGDDILTGGLGNDYLSGGAGMDIFKFDSALMPGNLDRIGDFTPVDDVMHLKRSIFSDAGSFGTLSADAFKIGLGNVDASDRIIYDDVNGMVYYDADGSDAVAAIAFAQLTPGLALTNADFILF